MFESDIVVSLFSWSFRLFTLSLPPNIIIIVMEEEKPKKKRKQKAAAEGDGEKAHKKNWREYLATVEDIQTFLANTVLLRQNAITGRPEFRVPMKDEFEALGMIYPTGGKPLDEWRSAVVWQPVCDRLVNTLWAVLKTQKEVSRADIWSVIDSDFVPLYNPLCHYLDSLPPPDVNRGAIFELAMTVTVKGGTEEQALFYLYLRKWLVGMVAGWVDEVEVNNCILVLVGRQGIFKTTWFNSLLPPDLQSYFHSNTSFGNMTKDEVLKLSQYGLICCEELDTMKPSEMNRLKWAVTTPVTDERRPYAHYSERRKHIASYCGTGNNVQFIDDSTGTRRWLPFEVESIENPREHPIDHDAVFAEAYDLYRQGFQYWFNDEEMQVLQCHNERFEVAKPERELISKYYRLPNEHERGEFVSNTDILMTIGGNLLPRLNSNSLGRAMTALGFQRMRSHGQRGYTVVAYSAEEIKANRSVLAYDARPESDPEEAPRDTNDTIF